VIGGLSLFTNAHSAVHLVVKVPCSALQHSLYQSTRLALHPFPVAAMTKLVPLHYDALRLFLVVMSVEPRPVPNVPSLFLPLSLFVSTSIASVWSGNWEGAGVGEVWEV